MTPYQSADQIARVRTMVRGLLENTEAFADLPEAERRSVATSLVKIMNYLADPYAGIDVASPPVAAALEDDKKKDSFTMNEKLRDRLAERGPTAGQDFKAGATGQMGEQFKELVKAVDFPKFVSGLIEGVFTSIVNSSIKQMKAFQQMLEGIAKSVDQFAKETISEATAREYLKNAHPRALDIDVDEDGARLSMSDEATDEEKAALRNDLGLKEDPSLDDRESEGKVIFEAQRKLAKQRQQMLATMVLMGINRIVVTDGEIKASVMFDVKAKDRVSRDRFASTSDTHTQNKLREAGGGWFDDSYEQETETKVSTAYSSEKEQSLSEIEAKAKLTGSVTVKFKSETFPLERFASSEMLGFVNEKGRA
jgi:hypothetical protein